MPYTPSLILVTLGGLLIFLVIASNPNAGKSLIKDADLRAFLALASFVACVTLAVLDVWIRGGDGRIPDWLLGMTGTIIGFFFQNKSNQESAQRAAEAVVAASTSAADSTTITDARKVDIKHGPAGGGGE